MTTNQSTTVAGRAVYLELSKPGMTTQVLLMPEGLSSKHVTIPMSVYRRRISTMQPRKTWRYAAGAKSSSSVMASSPVASVDPISFAIIDFALNYLQGLARAGWTVLNAPIIVEVTPEDLTEASMGKTPYKVLGRVWKVRKKMGFPKEFIQPVA